MPVSTEAPRCSEFARSIAVLPPGTGLFLDRVIMVSVPLPWPKPAAQHEILAPLAPMLKNSSVTSRLFAMEPVGPGIDIEVYERSGGNTRHYRWSLSDAAKLQAITAAIAAAPLGELARVDPEPAVRASETAEIPPTFLVCTQGSHDTCCGTSGVSLADDIEAERPDYVVRRVSHTGGHRFSPTFLSFPQGRMWAFADLALVDRIASTAVTSDDFRNHQRGWWGAKVGPAQVAEGAVRAERPDLESTHAIVRPIDGAPGEPATAFHVSVGEQSWRVQVRVGRTIPSVSCESPGGLPAKPGREFAWTIEPE